jgi:hypothetical protein
MQWMFKEGVRRVKGSEPRRDELLGAHACGGQCNRARYISSETERIFLIHANTPNYKVHPSKAPG